MKPPRVRRLTPNEIALAREVFGSELRVETVRIMRTPWPFTRAFVPGRWFGREWVLWPSLRYESDMALASLAIQSTFVHELVHVWQAQRGVNLLFAKLKAGDSASSYHYEVSDSCHWDGLNIEQQAMVVEHRFRLSRGMNVPADSAFYDRVCPLVANPKIV